MGKGPSIGNQNKHGLNQLRGQEMRSTSAESMSEDLSDIDDAEILPYLNKEKEIQIKKIFWEILNRKYSEVTQSTQPKAARNLKKVTPAEKAVKVSAEKENKKRASSKINYDVLKKLLDDECCQSYEEEEIPSMAERSKKGSASDTPLTNFRATEESDDGGDDYNDDSYGEENVLYINGENEYMDGEGYL